MLIPSSRCSALCTPCSTISRCCIQPHIFKQSRSSYATLTHVPPHSSQPISSIHHHPTAVNDPLTQYIYDNIATITRYSPLSSGSHRLSISRTLPEILPYEPYPEANRRADSSQSLNDRQGDGIVVVVHLFKSGPDNQVDFVISSGFVVQPDGPQEEQMVITCSHTLDQISNRYSKSPIYSFILSSVSTSAPVVLPITAYPSCSVADLLICTIHPSNVLLRSLPVSPFPVYRGQEVLVHEFTSQKTSRGIPWIGGMMQREWRSAEMLGYRNYGWREVQPGTSSVLPYIIFSTRPINGSSGGPILDAASGAVVGIVSGSRTLSAVEGERGWGASAENIFELFSLPGFIPASRKKRL
ncbi:uncharacterized protein L199_003709 [Kwoniella botswanensis]|uniref:uncharacterized protein n=1 Tax=Kwoniella botswanensis TaxID=1268659 RepID=UPI00315D56ED